MSYDVALSYGHGSNTFPETDSKGVIVNGQRYAEHTFNAITGEMTRKIIEAHGLKVLVVQPPEGRDVPLSTRTKKANDAKVKLYYSIHANAASKEVRGLCAFYWSTSDAGRRLAEYYAGLASAEGFPLYHRGTYASVKGTWNDFHELRETKMDALLTENGFMTNAEDFQYIFHNKDSFHERTARIHAKTILHYFGIPYKEELNPMSNMPNPPLWDGSLLRPGQIGRIRILKPINLWERDAEDNLAMVRVLQPGEQYRVYRYDDKHQGQYNVGGNNWITKMDGYIMYETPSKALLEKAKEFYA